MNIQVAREIAKSAFRSTRELGNLILDLRGKLGPDEYQSYAKATAAAIAAVQMNVLNKVIADCPQLEKEIEDSIARTGAYS